jgi:hypothetical protein
MNAKEARAITDKAKDLPEGILTIMQNILMIANYGHDEVYYVFEELTEEQKDYLRENGYYLKNVKHVFGVGNPPKVAIQISW